MFKIEPRQETIDNINEMNKLAKYNKNFVDSIQSTQSQSSSNNESNPNNNNNEQVQIKRGSLQLWQFLVYLLDEKKCSNIIQWTSRVNAEFKLVDPEEVARQWGQQKNRPTMNYDKLSRSLRYYYEKGIMKKVSGERYVYKFICNININFDKTSATPSLNNSDKHQTAEQSKQSMTTNDISQFIDNVILRKPLKQRNSDKYNTTPKLKLQQQQQEYQPSSHLNNNNNQSTNQSLYPTSTKPSARYSPYQSHSLSSSSASSASSSFYNQLNNYHSTVPYSYNDTMYSNYSKNYNYSNDNIKTEPADALQPPYYNNPYTNYETTPNLYSDSLLAPPLPTSAAPATLVQYPTNNYSKHNSVEFSPTASSVSMTSSASSSSSSPSLFQDSNQQVKSPLQISTTTHNSTNQYLNTSTPTSTAAQQYNQFQNSLHIHHYHFYNQNRLNNQKSPSVNSNYFLPTSYYNTPVTPTDTSYSSSYNNPSSMLLTTASAPNNNINQNSQSYFNNCTTPVTANTMPYPSYLATTSSPSYYNNSTNTNRSTQQNNSSQCTNTNDCGYY